MGIAKMKAFFFMKLKAMKTHGQDESMESLLSRMHQQFADAGMPDDRIDYILGKWLHYKYPEALDTKETPNVVIQGFNCANGYGQFVNQEYEYKGVTADGRPYYQGLTDNTHFLYYDKHCADDTPDGAWILGQKPSLERQFDLNEYDGEGCNNDFHINTESKHVPLGFQKTSWNWCGDHGVADTKYVSVGYKSLYTDRSKSPTKVEKQEETKDRKSPAIVTAQGSNSQMSVVV